MARPELKLAPPARSPQREALADAITHHRNILDAVEANRLAQEGLNGTIRTAAIAVERGSTTVEEAKLNATAFLMAQARGETVEAPLSVKGARADAQNAQDTLDAAKDAMDGLKREGESLLQSARWAADKINSRTEDVIRSELDVDKLLSELDTLARHWIDKALALKSLIGNGVDRNCDHGLTRAYCAAGRLSSPPVSWGLPLSRDANPTFEAWQRALADLAIDPETVLPV